MDKKAIYPLSKTKLNTFLTCQEKWRLIYHNIYEYRMIEGKRFYLPKIEKMFRTDFEYGKEIHKLIEDFLTGKDPEIPAKYKRIFQNFLDYYDRLSLQSYMDNLYIEERLSIKKTNSGFELTEWEDPKAFGRGVIDNLVLDKEKKRIILIDWKTGEVDKYTKEEFYLYSLLLYGLLGKDTEDYELTLHIPLLGNNDLPNSLKFNGEFNTFLKEAEEYILNVEGELLKKKREEILGSYNKEECKNCEVAHACNYLQKVKDTLVIQDIPLMILENEANAEVIWNKLEAIEDYISSIRKYIRLKAEKKPIRISGGRCFAYVSNPGKSFSDNYGEVLATLFGLDTSYKINIATEFFKPSYNDLREAFFKYMDKKEAEENFKLLEIYAKDTSRNEFKAIPEEFLKKELENKDKDTIDREEVV